MKPIALTLLAGLLTSSGVFADSVAITADRMVDVVAGTVIDHPAIVITDGRITAVGRQDAVAIPADARRVALPAGMTLLPGLIDMHVHLTSDPRLSGYKRCNIPTAYGK
jgi:imidazolonepropionase-like amidohydrolase